MKVYIGPYVTRWTSHIFKKWIAWRYKDNTHKPGDGWDDFISTIEDILQWIYNHTINLYLDRKKQKVCVKLHHYDTWSIDYTLSLIILPMLKQLQETQHGSPFVEPKDVPENLTDEHKRWDWILNEMIWTFTQISNENSEEFHVKEFDKEAWKTWGERISRGTQLFGKYYQGLWD